MTSRQFVVIGFSLACLTVTASTGRAQQGPPPPRNVDPVLRKGERTLRLSEVGPVEAKRIMRQVEAQIRARQGARGLLVDPVIVEADRPVEPPAPADEVDDGAPPPPPKLLIAEANFDRVIFAHLGNADEAQNSLDLAFKMWTENVDRVLTLTPAQREKLRLAGRGDIKRLLNQIAVKRQEFRSVQRDMNRYQVFVSEVQPLRLKVLTGPFGEGSLSAKVLQSIRDEARKPRRVE
jgi:hypothetical protein